MTISEALRTWSRRPVLQDAALAAVLLAACVLVNAPNAVVTATSAVTSDGATAGRLTTWWAATALALVAVALRRRWPLPMFVASSVAAGTHAVQPVPLMIVDLAVPILLYTVAVRYGRALSLGVLAGLLLFVTGWSLYSAAHSLPVPGLPGRISMARTDPAVGGPIPPSRLRPDGMLQDTWSGTLVLGSLLAAAWATGSGARNRRAYLLELRAHNRDLEEQRDQRAALAVAAERGRISRELHDVVAHGLSVMVTQAQGGAAALDNRPTDTRTALDAIIKTGRDSLADMRRVLARVDGVDDAWHPQPGLDHLPALIAQVTKAGTPVRLRVEGARPELPSAVDLSAYRIVQEALTNTMKHAGAGATADVVLAYRDAEVGIEVTDDGHGTSTSDGAGNGLRGMRERARLLSGRLAAGPGPTGGFVVRAALPIQGPNA